MKPKSRNLLFALGTALAVTSTQAAEYTYTVPSGAADSSDDWSTDPKWDMTPVSDPTTSLVFTLGATGNSQVQTTDSINDIADPFQLNMLTFNSSPNAGFGGANIVALNISGNPLEFVSDGGTSPVINLDGNRSNGQQVRFNVANNITLSADTLLTGTGTASYTFSGNITGGNALNIQSGGGASALTFSGTNDFTGDVSIGGGTLTFSNLASWGGTGKDVTFTGNGTLASTANGYSAGSLTVDPAVTATILNSSMSFGTTAGSGTLINSIGQSGKVTNIGDASTFTGTLRGFLSGNANMTTNDSLQFSGLGDAVGSALQFRGGTSDSNQGYTIAYNGTSALTFDNRQVQILDRATGNWEIRDNILANDSADSAHTWVINTDLSNQGGRAGSFGPQLNRALVFGGSNVGNNEFAGIISDGVVDGIAFNVGKIDAGTWILSGANTYTGNTTVSDGTLGIASSAELLFVIGALGTTTLGVENNAILGSANNATLNIDGLFRFNLTDAGTDVGLMWDVLDEGRLTETYGTSFAVASTNGAFTDNGGGIWTRDENGTTYEFTQSTGVLTVIPEPASALLGGLGCLLLLRRRRA